MLGQRLDATKARIEGIADTIQGVDAKKLKVLANHMRKIAIRWANLYHNERQQALDKVASLEKEIEKLKRT